MAKKQKERIEIYIVIYAAAFITCLIAIISKKIFNELNMVLSVAMGEKSE